MKIIDLHNKPHPEAFIYCGRGMGGKIPQLRRFSPLCNPYRIQQYPDALDLFRKRLFDLIRRKNGPLLLAMREIAEDSILACWCCEKEGDAIYTDPEVCHVQIVLKARRWMIGQSLLRAS